MTTLLQLRTRARSRADMVNSTFVTDDEFNTWLNLGYQELYDIVVASYEDYFSAQLPFTITSGDTYTLPDDFYKLRGLDFQNSGSWQVCREFTFSDRNNSQVGTNYWMTAGSGRSYRIMGDQLLLQPTQSAAGNYRLWYTPAPALLTTDVSLIPNSLTKFGWDEYVVLYAAERALSKEESSITDVVNERAELGTRIKKMAQDRQIAQSSTIQDVQGSYLNANGRWYDT